MSATYPKAVEIARRASGKAKVVTYAVNGKADYRADDERFSADGAHFRIHTARKKTKELLLPMSGYHNVENAAGVYAATRSIGLSHDQIAHGFETFAGVKRRQEVRGEPGGVLVIDDFAHHPTAVRETIEAIHERYPDRRLWAVFEPRSNTSRRNIHQKGYAASFVGAVGEGDVKDFTALELNAQGIVADSSEDVAELMRRVSHNAQPGDLILVMSNGAFGGFIPSLLDNLHKRFGGPGPRTT